MAGVDLMLLASLLALRGYRVLFGPADRPGGPRPFTARRGGRVIAARPTGVAVISE